MLLLFRLPMTLGVNLTQGQLVIALYGQLILLKYVWTVNFQIELGLNQNK